LKLKAGSSKKKDRTGGEEQAFVTLRKIISIYDNAIKKLTN